MVMSGVIDRLSRATAYLIPLLVLTVGVLMLRGRRPYFDAFVKGARNGLQTAVRLCPTLMALLVAIGMLQASGAVARVGAWLSPVF
jgi:spore maturation protein B